MMYVYFWKHSKRIRIILSLLFLLLLILLNVDKDRSNPAFMFFVILPITSFTMKNYRQLTTIASLALAAAFPLGAATNSVKKTESFANAQVVDPQQSADEEDDMEIRPLP